MEEKESGKRDAEAGGTVSSGLEMLKRQKVQHLTSSKKFSLQHKTQTLIYEQTKDLLRTKEK